MGRLETFDMKARREKSIQRMSAGSWLTKQVILNTDEGTVSEKQWWAYS